MLLFEQLVQGLGEGIELGQRHPQRFFIADVAVAADKGEALPEIQPAVVEGRFPRVEPGKVLSRDPALGQLTIADFLTFPERSSPVPDSKNIFATSMRAFIVMEFQATSFW